MKVLSCSSTPPATLTWDQIKNVEGVYDVVGCSQRIIIVEGGGTLGDDGAYARIKYDGTDVWCCCDAVRRIDTYTKSSDQLVLSFKSPTS